ncbi:MAG: hypothetical protein M3539_12225, partial [Acidobacteriota bacterium]|nr:hypothetical protein [Acidobacteriota bacterium]
MSTAQTEQGDEESAFLLGGGPHRLTQFSLLTPKALPNSSPGFRAALPWDRNASLIKLAGFSRRQITTQNQ